MKLRRILTGFRFSRIFPLLVISLLLSLPQVSMAATSIKADFNGDGYEDLAIGVPGEDIDGIVDGGAVQVYYGSAAGISTTNQFWTLDSPGVQLAAASGDRFGSALTAGDFNQDGYADLAIGIPFRDTAKGSVLVLYGSSSGLTATGNQVWDQDILQDTRENDDRLGSAVVAGDFNGDGYSDLAIGVPGEDYPDIGPPTTGIPKCSNGICLDAGIVNLVYGGPNGLTAAGNEIWNQDLGGDSYDGWVEWEDCFGSALAAGDFDGNGIDDLAVGVVCEQTGGEGESTFNNGAVSLYYGTTSGLTGAGAQYLRQWAPAITGFPQINDAFGYALAAGDFNKDGFADLAIGIPGEETDNTGPADSGAVAVFYGRAGAGITAYNSSNNEIWYRNSPGVQGTNITGARFGTALATGDFNGDGFTDVAISAPMDLVDGVPEAGSISILFGSANRLTSNGNQYISQNSPDIIDSAEAYDWFGFTLTAGDFNNDGRSDLAIGVPFEDIGNISDAGAVNVLYGAQNLGLTSNGNQFLSQNSPNSQDAAEAGDQFGGRLPPRLYQSPWPDQPSGGIPPGPLTGVVAVAPKDVNLTSVGTTDWIHWGRTTATAVDRKAGVSPQISTYTPIGNPTPTTQVSSGYSWTDGTPTTSVSGSQTGLWVFNVGKGFEFTVPADTTVRTLKVYVGATAARGKLEAILSDGSAANYVTLIDQPSGKTSQEVTLRYQAGSAGQTLTVRYTIDALYLANFKSWITLESAALQGGGTTSNLAPVLSPIGSQTVTEGQLLTVPVSATDTDGPAPLTLSASNLPAGATFTDNGGGSGTFRWTPPTGSASGSPYSVTVTATDGEGAASSKSFTITVSPSGSGGSGSLSGFTAIAANNVNLTAVGTTDWIHWGRTTATAVDRKAGVSPQISTYMPIGNPTPTSQVASSYSWSDGTPQPSISGTRSGLWVFREGMGFEFTVPADTSTHTLKVYVGATAARGRLEAILSDGSAPNYVTLIDQPSGRTSREVTLMYQAGSAGQTLTVRYTIDALYQANFKSWITLESAALDGSTTSNLAPILSPIGAQYVEEGQLLTVPIQATDADGPAPLALTQTNSIPGNPSILNDYGDGIGEIYWTPPAGSASGSPYSVTVTATDGAGASSSKTFSITVVPPGGGGSGSLTGIASLAAANVNLTTVGTADWIHWGRTTATEVDRKAGVSPQISTYTPIGNPTPTNQVSSRYSWSDGTPIPSIDLTRSGLWVFREGMGFEFTVPADTTPRTLNVYVGATAARGRLEAILSDGSAPNYVTMIDQPSGRTSRQVRISYQAASVGQTLLIRYTIDTLYLPDFKSWITLESAGLQNN